MKGFLIIILFSALILTGLVAIAVDKAYGQHAEPFEFTWTIINYYSSGIAPVSQLVQEQAIERRMQVWADELNMNLVFVKNAAKSDVYCWVTFESIPRIGAGGGDPGEWCQFTIGNNQRLYVGERPQSTYIYRNLEAIAGHESGHAFGLTHKSVGSCIMFSNYGDGLSNTPCAAELQELLLAWADVENPPANTIVDGIMKSFVGPSQVVKEDIVPIDFTIENIGNISINRIVWFFDKTDLFVIKSGPFFNLGPNESASGTIFWDTSTASLGTHEIQAHWFVAIGDINSNNNVKTIFITVTEDVIPPPPPPPEPEDPVFQTCVLPNLCSGPGPWEYFINYEETVSTADFIEVTHIIGPIDQSPRIIELEIEVSDLKDVIVNLTNVINIANNVITDLNNLTTDLENNIILLNDEIVTLTQGIGTLLTEISQLNNIINQIKILITP